jgi:hypothetical protein
MSLYFSPCSRRLKKRLAAAPFRRSCTKMSSTTPCWSTARHRYCNTPRMRMNTSSRCQVSPSCGRRRRKVSAELQAPVPDAFMGHHDTAFRQDQLDVAQADAEDVIQPDRVADDLRGKPMTGIRGAFRIHAGSPARLPSEVQARINLPMPAASRRAMAFDDLAVF